MSNISLSLFGEGVAGEIKGERKVITMLNNTVSHLFALWRSCCKWKETFLCVNITATYFKLT